MIYSTLNINYDVYLRDYLFNLVLIDNGALDVVANFVYFIYFAIGIKFWNVASLNIPELINSLYYSNLYYYFVTPIMEVMYNVHREYYIILTAILVIILYILYIELFYFRHVSYRYSINNNFMLELVWSILPALITLHFMLMTIALLYISDEHTFFGFQVKVVGHQWYWEYDIAKCFSSVESIYTNLSDAIIPKYHSMYSGFGPRLSWNLYKKDLDHFSVLITDHHLVKNSKFIKYNAERLLDTEGVLYTPYHTHVRLLITSMDVIHSFTIPSLGIKADAIPGRLNDLHFFLTDNIAMTHYFGQCSELCGVGHAFMPIHMISI